MKLCNVNKICLKASCVYLVNPSHFEIPKGTLKPTSKNQNFSLVDWPSTRNPKQREGYIYGFSTDLGVDLEWIIFNFSGLCEISSGKLRVAVYCLWEESNWSSQQREHLKENFLTRIERQAWVQSSIRPLLRLSATVHRSKGEQGFITIRDSEAFLRGRAQVEPRASHILGEHCTDWTIAPVLTMFSRIKSVFAYIVLYLTYMLYILAYL